MDAVTVTPTVFGASIYPVLNHISKEPLQAVPTAYAFYQAGSSLKSDSSGAYEPVSWRLRSPGNRSNTAATVREDGSLDTCEVDLYSIYVRPAMWVDLGSECFLPHKGPLPGSAPGPVR